MKRLLTLLLCLIGMSAQSLTIIRDFAGGDPPRYTSGGGNIEDIFNAACDLWELAILDQHTVKLRFAYGPMGGGSLADHQAWDWDSNGREILGGIVLANDHDWVTLYLDPNPYDTQEYQQSTNAWHDLGGGPIVTGRYFTGPDHDAHAGLDVFSILLHEIGHALGLSTENPNWETEAADFMIEIKPPLPYAGTLILLNQGNGIPIPHINCDGPVMAGVAEDVRVWPSYEDILAIAQMSHFTNVNLDLRPVLHTTRYPKFDALPAKDGRISVVDYFSRWIVQPGGFISITNQMTDVDRASTARFVFYAPEADNYVLKALVRALDGSSNSVWISIDGAPTEDSMVWDVAITQGFEWRVASWRGGGDFQHSEFVPKVWPLTEGFHELYISGRERGCEILTLAVVRADGKPSPGFGAITLDWSAHCEGFRVQTCGDLRDGWETITENSGKAVAGRYWFALPPDAGLRLLRLQRNERGGTP